MVVNIDKYIDEFEAGLIGGGFAVGPVSYSPELVQDTTGPPTLSTLPASTIETHDHADGATSGLKFEFTVPESYDNGPLTLYAIYAMSTGVANPNNVIVLNVGAEIADATGGGIDTATYTPTPISETTPDGTTDVTRSGPLLTIANTDFSIGDKIVFLVERLGADGSDAHTGAWKLVDYMVTFEGQVSNAASIHQVEVFSDTAGTPAVPGTKSSFDTLNFEEGSTNEQKFQWTIPDNWDGTSDFHVRFTYAMTSASAAAVRLDLSGDVASVNTGAITALTANTHIISTTADTDVHRTTVALSIPGPGRTPGDAITVVFNRPSGDAADTHTGDWQLIGAQVYVGQGGASASIFSEAYMGQRDFRIVSASGVNGQQESADFSGEFELWSFMDSSIASGRIDVEWQGRLRPTQTTIKSIKIPIRGQSGGPTPQYQIKVYVEGSGASNVFTGSALTPETTGSRILVTIADTELSAQPTGEKRYFVVVEAHLDAGEELRVGTPYVRQE